ncbi:MAG: hypothetical protein LBD11_09035 [Candidatus Peribacteria bacterium]|nr:hypothetical protein [Candidatus Peribacteria bacterium]
MITKHGCGCHQRIGDYSLCSGCHCPIPRGNFFCNSCEKKEAQERKEKEKENKKKQKRQKKELETNPPHQCHCEPKLMNARGGMQVFNEKTQKFQPLHPRFGYACQRDERTGVLVCKTCGGTPPKGSTTRESISL